MLSNEKLHLEIGTKGAANRIRRSKKPSVRCNKVLLSAFLDKKESPILSTSQLGNSLSSLMQTFSASTQLFYTSCSPCEFGFAIVTGMVVAEAKSPEDLELLEAKMSRLTVTY